MGRHGKGGERLSRKKKIVLVVALAVLVLLGGLCVWQWNNISAALSFVRFSQEELEGKLDQNDQTIKDAVDAIPNVTIRDVTEEEKQALKDGTLTQEELVQDLIQSEPKPEKPPESKPEQKPTKVEDTPATPGQGSQPPKAEDTPSPQPEQKPQQEEKPPQQNEYEKKLNELIAQVYVLREEFLIKLDQTQAAAIADYKAIPADQRTTKTIAALVSGYMTKGLEMEKECDERIKAIVLEMETLLQENGGDLNIAQTVYDTYLEEKSLKNS